MEIKDVVKEVEDGFIKFMALADNFPPDKYDVVLVGESKFKDILAHIWEWERFLLSNLPIIQDGTIIPHKLNIKKMNLGFYKENRNKSFDVIKENLERTHKKLIQLLMRFPASLLTNPDPFYSKKYNVFNLIQHATSLHYHWAITYIKKYQK